MNLNGVQIGQQQSVPTWWHCTLSLRTAADVDYTIHVPVCFYLNLSNHQHILYEVHK